jgi:ATP-binding cassette, subfamily B, bacterial
MNRPLQSCFEMLQVGWRESRSKLLWALGLSVAAGFSGPLVALALRAAINDAVAHDVSSATMAGAVFGAAAIGVLTLKHFAFTAQIEVADASMVTLEAELISLANGSPRLDHHERADFADMLELLQQEVTGLIAGLGALVTITTLSVSLTVTGIILASVSPLLLLLPLASIPPVLAGARATAIVERGKEDAATQTRQSWHLFRMATGADSAKELRVFRLQRELRRRNRELWQGAGAILAAAQFRAMLVGAAGQICFAAAYVLAVLLVVRQAVADHRAVGDVVLVITLATQVNQQINLGMQELRNVQRVSSGFARLRWLRVLVAEQQPPPADALVPHRVARGIELQNVEFTYPGTDSPVLRQASVLLPAGMTVAVVGENGAGKTTLMKLLCRFYDPSAGAITLDDVDISRLPLDEWRSRIAVGFQDFVRYELIAKHVVGVGEPDLMNDAQAVLSALDRAHARDVVERLDLGLETPLGKTYQQGTELSGGQWQKMALGRAMMRASPLLLILDEPTASLDAATEHQLFERYAETARRLGRETGAITVLVSHRFSTVRAADLILVLKDGCIQEAGAHVDLIQRDGIYAELYGLHEAAYR